VHPEVVFRNPVVCPPAGQGADPAPLGRQRRVKSHGKYGKLAFSSLCSCLCEDQFEVLTL